MRTDIAPRQAGTIGLGGRSRMPAVLRQPAALETVERGPQGRPGKDGATFQGFGSVTFTEAASAPALALPANTRTQLQFTPDPAQADDTLQAPFAGHLFWSNNVIVGRALNDALDILVNLLVVSQVAGGQLRLDIDVGSVLGPIVTAGASLFEAAGVTERVTLERMIRTKSGLLANGGALYLTSTVPVSITRASVVVFPNSAGAP